MTDRISQDLNFLQQSIRLRAQRQEALSSNIANADTPHYKARDFDFAEALRGALGGRMNLPDTSLSLTSRRHIPAKAISSDPQTLMYRVPAQPSLDGNTVDMDVERVNFADNTLRYQTGLMVISGRIKSLMAALQQ